MSGGTRVVGTVSVHPKGFGFLKYETPDGPRTAFIRPPDLTPFVHGDDIEATLTELRKGRWEARDPRLVERHRHALFGEVHDEDGILVIEADRQVTNARWPLRDGPFPVEPGELVVARIEGAFVVPERIVDPRDASLEKVRTRFGVRLVFPEAALADVPAPVPIDGSGRRDLRDIPTVTIDAPTSRDLDDALAALPADATGGLRILVSIADVDSIVKAGSQLDREARLRGTSVYLAGGVTPMLPRALSEDRLSLLPGVDRLTLTAELRIDPEGHVTSVDVYESIIRSACRLDYKGVAAFLEKGDDSAIPAPVRETVRWLRTAVARLSHVRTARGGVRLLRTEAKITVDDETREPTDIEARIDNAAHLLVERLMVAANEAVAGWLHARGLPAVYRVHPVPDPRAVATLEESVDNFGFHAGFGGKLSPRSLAAFEDQMAGSPVEPAMHSVLVKLLGPARYTVQPGAHFGLGSPLYLHFTSPIRRYADLAVHRVIKRYLHGDRTQQAGDRALEELAQHLNERARLATKAEAERDRMLAARHFSRRVGEILEGNVVGVKTFGLIVHLAGTGVTGAVTSERLPGESLRYTGHAFEGDDVTYPIGAPLRVRVIDTDEELGRIELELVASE